MKLIPEWRRAARMFSVQAAAAIVLWVGLPAETQAQVLGLLPLTQDQVTGLLAVLGIIGRLIAQPKVR